MTTTMNFLDEIVGHKRRRIQRAKSAVLLSEMRDRAFAQRAGAKPFALRAAIKEHKHQFAIIAEFKRASPSKGNIQLQADPVGTALQFEQSGAAAISVLTEEDYFRGSLKDLKSAKAAVSIPVLRKDFIVDEYQVLETAAANADALLLIVAALDDEQLQLLRRLAEDELRMDALVEVHTVEEMQRAASCGAKLIGVNNRNLRSFAVSLDVSAACIASAPADSVLISESGLRDKADLQRMHAAGFHGFLIGEALMRAEEPGAALRALLAEAREWP